MYLYPSIAFLPPHPVTGAPCGHTHQNTDGEGTCWCSLKRSACWHTENLEEGVRMIWLQKQKTSNMFIFFSLCLFLPLLLPASYPLYFYFLYLHTMNTLFGVWCYESDKCLHRLVQLLSQSRYTPFHHPPKNPHSALCSQPFSRLLTWPPMKHSPFL